MIYAVILFAITYILMLALPKYRTYVALASALCFIVSGMLPLENILESIDFNVLLMIAGTMGIVSMFIESRMPARLADAIIAHVPNVCWATIALSLFAGIISAFVDNVATVLMVAPVALAIAKRIGVKPVEYLAGGVLLAYAINAPLAPCPHKRNGDKVPAVVVHSAELALCGAGGFVKKCGLIEL